MLGLHLNTVTRWRSRAATDWTAYLQAWTSSRTAGQPESAAARVNQTGATPTSG
ncbi:hypothetical protein P3T27_007391 [Kitasatospora sp. MAA19]|uniref:hypothetical protein n=1 Tax=unclassified Kitasatospora TaxID=2633591 RepID=UPI002475BD93|nr:hypothetical protein [Kitasatospora sp. MAA19]MDH6710641.1 hypothetical protein [Kitasatospora sp. MAA19]